MSFEKSNSNHTKVRTYSGEKFFKNGDHEVEFHSLLNDREDCNENDILLPVNDDEKGGNYDRDAVRNDNNKDADVEQIKTWWRVHYIIDYLITAVVLMLALVVNIPGAIPYFKTYYTSGDDSISYPYIDSIIPGYYLGIFFVGTSLIVFIICQLFVRSSHDFHHACLGYSESYFYTLFVVGLLKVAAGRLRPNFKAIEQTSDKTMMYTEIDSHFSFPSGHSALTFASATFLVLYLCGKMSIFSVKYQPPFVKVLLAFSPLIASTVTAISRTMDYHHNFSDIIAGALIGIFISFIAYWRRYHSLFSPKCSLPRL